MTASISYSFSPTTTIVSSQVNQNFTDLVNFLNNTASPVGLVAMWKGSIASIPTGWTLDTDLRDKMAIGAGNLYAYGDTGGEATHTLTLSEIPTIDLDSYMNDPGHTHAIDVVPSDQDGSGSNGSISGSKSTGSATTGITWTPFGGGAAHNNLPPYYALAYIRRT